MSAGTREIRFWAATIQSERGRADQAVDAPHEPDGRRLGDACRKQLASLIPGVLPLGVRVCRSGPQHALEPAMARHESLPLVEPVRISSPNVGRELDPVAPGILGRTDRESKELLADTSPTDVWMHVHGLHLRTAAPLALEVTEHDQLTHRHY